MSDLGSAISALVFGAVFLLFLEVLRLRFPRHRRPPGPTPCPFIGNLPQLLLQPLETFTQMKDRYGDLSTIYLGRTPAVLLNGIGVTKEALVHRGAEFAGRPSIPVLDWIINGLGILMAPYGDSWKQQRRFSLVTLRNFGLGKRSLEERIAEEAKCLIQELEEQGGQPYNPQFLFHNAASNIICSIVFGNRFDYSDEAFVRLLRIMNNNAYLTGSPIAQLFNLAPFIKHFPGPHQKIQQNAREVLEFVGEAVKQHRDTLDRDNLRDFIDAYIVEMERQRSNPESTFFEENLIMTIADLFIAGTDTTSTTLRWGLVYLMEFPDIQERCHQEIVRVAGYDRLPSVEDRAKMPYVEATISEIQRCANIAAFGMPHAVTRDTSLHGYFLPKGTHVIPNMSSILSDKAQWKFPHHFNPDNFLDAEGHFERPEAFIPFSAGQRACLGEKLARMELFLFFTSLLQRLKFMWPPGAGPADLKGTVGFVRSPHPFHMICQSRDPASPST
ncbi:cytochrome P450 2B4-like isoform X1 [Lepisosteus oculatus]|uniref:cytochrome P450 2B4-like isoform X1 n=1 Tax=Lepisosteus oculatus TaxID=7918 RepID=UPI0037114F65